MSSAAPGQIFGSIDWHAYRQSLNLSGRASAKDIKALSDIYISEKGSPDIWINPAFREAYLNYFFPLNLIRALFMCNWAKELRFFDGIDHVQEFGSGPGTLQIAFEKLGVTLPWSVEEASGRAFETHLQLAKFFGLISPNRSKNYAPIKRNGLFLSSYTLTETELPMSMYKYDGVILLEASTKANFLRLNKIRTTLIEKGFSIWGPCTHQSECPMASGRNDWCHFRVPVEIQPYWFEELENDGLPMKKDTLTFSYLLARRTPSPLESGHLRVIGQTLEEKGKTRQSICRGPEREYLSWLNRDGQPDRIASGTLMKTPNDIIIKGNELRLPKG